MDTFNPDVLLLAVAAPVAQRAVPGVETIALYRPEAMHAVAANDDKAAA
jgi:hypothetical protein